MASRYLTLWDVSKLLKDVVADRGAEGVYRVPDDYVGLLVRSHTLICGIPVDLVLPLGEELYSDGKNVYFYLILSKIGRAVDTVIFDTEGRMYGICRDDKYRKWIECVSNEPIDSGRSDLADYFIQRITSLIEPYPPYQQLLKIARSRLIESVLNKVVYEVVYDVIYRELDARRDEGKTVFTMEDIESFIRNTSSEVLKEIEDLSNKMQTMIEIANRFPELVVTTGIEAILAEHTDRFQLRGVKVFRHGNSKVVTVSTFGIGDILFRITIIPEMLECFLSTESRASTTHAVLDWSEDTGYLGSPTRRYTNNTL